MTKYAAKTEVPVEKSQLEILKLLKRYNATDFGIGQENNHQVVAFKMKGKMVRIALPNPDPKSRHLTHTVRNQRRTPAQLKTALAQAERQLWRAMCLFIQARLDFAEYLTQSGISEDFNKAFELVFLADFVAPNGQTVAEEVLPLLNEAPERGGSMPPILLGGK